MSGSHVMQHLLTGAEPAPSGGHGRRQLEALKDSVRRDLEQLLNTRYRPLSPPPELPHLADTFLNYGLPDLATVNMLDGAKKAAFTRSIAQIITAFEPRLARVRVEFLAVREQERTLRFRIEGVMHTGGPRGSEHEPVVFDSTLEPVLRAVTVKDSPHG